MYSSDLKKLLGVFTQNPFAENLFKLLLIVTFSLVFSLDALAIWSSDSSYNSRDLVDEFGDVSDVFASQGDRDFESFDSHGFRIVQDIFASVIARHPRDLVETMPSFWFPNIGIHGTPRYIGYVLNTMSNAMSLGDCSNSPEQNNPIYQLLLSVNNGPHKTEDGFCTIITLGINGHVTQDPTFGETEGFLRYGGPSKIYFEAWSHGEAVSPVSDLIHEFVHADRMQKNIALNLLSGRVTVNGITYDVNINPGFKELLHMTEELETIGIVPYILNLPSVFTENMLRPVINMNVRTLYESQTGPWNFATTQARLQRLMNGDTAPYLRTNELVMMASLLLGLTPFMGL